MAKATTLFNLVEKALDEIDAFDDKYSHINFDNAKVNTLKGEIKTRGKDNFEEALQWTLWVVDKVQGLTVPTAFTDAEVDAKDPDIRTFDDET